MTVSPERVAIIVEKVEFVERCIRILAERQSVDPDEYVERIEVKDVVGFIVQLDRILGVIVRLTRPRTVRR